MIALLLQVPDGALALGLGTALAVAASAVVLRPLLREDEIEPLPAPMPTRDAETRASAVEALREIEFDRATGKLSDADYASLRTTYTREALLELRAKDAVAAHVAPGGAPTVADDDPVEVALRAFRARSAHCAVHGARPEADARFCSDCGRFLSARCPRCGAACESAEQRFCGDCGTPLAG